MILYSQFLTMEHAAKWLNMKKSFFFFYKGISPDFINSIEKGLTIWIYN